MRDVWGGILVGLLICIFYLASSVVSFPRDLDGHYATSDPEMHAWFNKLKSSKGLCCSFADGVSVRDVDWDTQGGSYRVRVCAKAPEEPGSVAWANCKDKAWVVVPDAALVTDPNKFGQAVVWPYGDSSGVTQIRCFIPGSGA